MRRTAPAGGAARRGGARGPVRRLALVLLLAVPLPAARPSAGPAQDAAAPEPRPSVAAPGEARRALDPEELDVLTARVAAELRCPVCRNQSVLESSAELSREMQGVIRDRLAAGQSPEEVKAWFVSRYGEWILLRPEPKGLNLLVYVLPAAALLLGALLLARVLRGRVTRAAAPPAAGAGADPPGGGVWMSEGVWPAFAPDSPPRGGWRGGGDRTADRPEDGLSPEDRRWLEEAIRSHPAGEGGTRAGSRGNR